MKNEATKEFRKKLADIFIQALTEKELNWKKGWVSGNIKSPVNAVTGKQYKGINHFTLMLQTMKAMDNGEIPDNRWATFKQINDKGWKVKAHSHGIKIEYWQAYDFLHKKPISWDDYQKNLRSATPNKNLGIIAKYYVVFNGRDIEGIPEFKSSKPSLSINDDLIKKISAGMDVKLINDGGNRAFYHPAHDIVHMPTKQSFISDYHYNSTALHELSHATGAAKRLNRNIVNQFGTEKYAYEELVAEISSCFMGEHLHVVQTKEHIENHKAYVQSWIKDIRDKPDVLIKAIRDAGSAADLLEYHAGILTKAEYQKIAENAEIEKAVSAPESNQVGLEKFMTESMEKKDKEHIIIPQDKKIHLKENGYKPTVTLLKKMNELDRITGKINTVKDILTAFKEHTFKDNPNAEKLVQSIGKILKNQELMKIPSNAPIK